MNKITKIYRYLDDPVLGFGVLSGFGLFFIARIASIMINEGLKLKFGIPDYFYLILGLIYLIGIIGCYYYLTDIRISKLSKFKIGFTISTIVLILGSIIGALLEN